MYTQLDILQPILDFNPIFKDHNITVSQSLTSPAHTQLMLNYLTGPCQPDDPSSPSIISQAGMVAIDFEGLLTTPSLIDPNAELTQIRSIQLAVPLTSLAVHVPLNCLSSSTKLCRLRPSIHVFVLNNLPDINIDDRQMMVNHLSQVINSTDLTTVVHCKSGDHQGLFWQFNHNMEPPIVDTQILYMHWSALSARVSQCFAAVAKHCPSLPPLDKTYLAPPLPDKSISSDFKPPTLSLYPSVVHHPDWERIADCSSGLNTVLSACNLPMNPYKNKVTKTKSSQFLYAVWDVAFLIQAYAHMSTAMTYLSMHLYALQSYSPPCNAPTSFRIDLFASPLDPDQCSNTDMSLDEQRLVYRIAMCVRSYEQMVHHPGHLSRCEEFGRIRAADLEAVQHAFQKNACKQVQQYLCKRTGGIRRAIQDYPDVFHEFTSKKAIVPLIHAPDISWVCLVRDPPKPPCSQ